MDAIQLNGVQRRLGTFELGPLTFSVPRGCVLALVGPNGAGKTTTLDMLIGMGRPDRGAITVLGMNMPRDEVAIKRQVAYVSPDLNFAPWGNVGHAIKFISGFYPDWNNQRCESLLQEFAISRNERIGALSFGARIKISLVMALARDSELLLLDEPTAGLDVESRLVLLKEIMQFIKREDRTVVISSHQLSDLERLADHVAILNKGKLLTTERMDDLINRYIRVDARIGTSDAWPNLPGITILEQGNDRIRLMLDEQLTTVSRLAQQGIEIVSETPMTLEEIFVALVAEQRRMPS